MRRYYRVAETDTATQIAIIEANNALGGYPKRPQFGPNCTPEFIARINAAYDAWDGDLSTTPPPGASVYHHGSFHADPDHAGQNRMSVHKTEVDVLLFGPEAEQRCTLAQRRVLHRHTPGPNGSPFSLEFDPSSFGADT